MSAPDPRPVIMGVRDGRGLHAEGAALIARGLVDGSVSDAQAGAFAMAVLLRGLDEDGRIALTRAMRDSGKVMRWDLPGPVVDKHSTGGVGDTVSLILAPALAACGAYVPMISGRGLGHTGGTLDKMQAIPGYRTNIDRATLDATLRAAGCAIIGATDEIAPADRRLYAIRDISGTVESIDLITASILSKKLAAGLDALILDVKCGAGAFMPDLTRARALARSLVDTANGAGCRTAALITDMDSPLAPAAGNAVETRLAIDLLIAPPQPATRPLYDVTVALGAEALVLAGLATTAEEGARRITQALASGQAAERFARMVAHLGGPADLMEHPDRHLPVAPAIPAPALHGTVAGIDNRALGDVVVHLGGGRVQQDDVLDMAVGLSGLARVGDRLDGPPAQVHAADPAQAAAAAAQVAAAYRLSPGPVAATPLILDRITSEKN